MIKHMKDKKMVGNSQHAFTQGKPGLTAFYHGMNGLEDKGGRVVAGYPASGEVLQVLSQHILIDKMME